MSKKDIKIGKAFKDNLKLYPTILYLEETKIRINSRGQKYNYKIENLSQTLNIINNFRPDLIIGNLEEVFKKCLESGIAIPPCSKFLALHQTKTTDLNPPNILKKYVY